MAELEIDREIILVVPFSLGAMVSLGLIEGDIIPFIDLSQTLMEVGDGEVAWSHLISFLSLGAVVVNRDDSWRDQLRSLGAVEAWIVWATLGMLIAPPLLPAFESFLTQEPAAVIALLVQTMGFGLVSYIN